MRNRLFFALAMTIVLSLLVVLLLAGCGAGQTDPPASGDWTVADTTVVSDRTVDLDGDLLVTSTGSLTLENVTLNIHVSTNGQHGIQVESGGSLYITDDDGQVATTTDASTVTAVPGTNSYYFIVEAGTTLRISNSFITRCGHTGMAGSTRLGLYIATDDAVISGTSIDDCLQGLVLRGATVTVTDTQVRNCTYHGVNAQDSIATLRGCTMADNGQEGARFMRGDAVVDGCQVLNNRNGMVIRTGCNATVSNTTVKGNQDGLFIELDPVVQVTGCTVRGQTQDGISVDYRVSLTLSDTLMGGNARAGLKASHDVVIESSGNTFRNNVYGAWLNMGSQMTSRADTFTGNTNSGINLEGSSDLILVEGYFSDNVAGLKGAGGSTIEAWATTMVECSFEGYKLTDADLDLHDGTLRNCTGGGIVPDVDSVARWTVHAGNSSVMVNADSQLTEDMSVSGDLVLNDVIIGFYSQGPPSNHGVVCTGGHQEWTSVMFRNIGPAGGIVFSIEGTATGSASYLTVDDGQSNTAPNDMPRVTVPFEFHLCTFRNSGSGLFVGHPGVLLDSCTFSGNGRGAEVVGAEVRFENCSFISNTELDVGVASDGHAVLVNCSFDPAKVALAGSGDRWSAWWTVNVHVSYTTGYAVEGADVEVRDASNGLVFQGTTGPGGNTPELLVLEHVTSLAGRDGRTPHTFTGTYGESHASGALNITQPTQVNLELADSKPPVLVITSHFDGEYVTSPLLTLKGTANDTGSGIYRVEARVATQSWTLAFGYETWEWSTVLPWDGDYPLSVRARDFALNEVVVYINITLDREPPTIDLNVPPTPQNNSVVGSPGVTIEGYTDDPDNSVSAGGVNATMDGTKFTINLTLVNGLNAITIQAVDRAGNSATLEWFITADLEAPPLTLTQPEDGALLNVTRVVIEGTTTPWGEVFYRVPELSNLWTQMTATGTGFFSQDITGLRQGINTIEVMVRDSAMNEVRVAHVVTVDTVAPTLVFSTPENGAYVAVSELNVTGNFSEVLTSLSAGAFTALVDGVNFSIDLDLKAGLNNIRLEATDRAGNVGVINLRFYLDQTPPGLDLPAFVWDENTSAFRTKYTNQRTFDLVGSSELGATVFVDTWAYPVDELGHFSAELPFNVDGEYLVDVRVVDRAGNEFATTLTIVLDTLAPQLEVDRPKDRARTPDDFVWVSGTVTRGDTVTIGEHVMVSENGTFRIKVGLEDPLTLLRITASDEAGNEVYVERLVFMVEDTEGLTGEPVLDNNCQSILVVMVIVIIAIGVILGIAWREEDVIDRRAKHLENMLEEDHIELDKPHLEPTTGYLAYDPTSPTGRRSEFEEKEDEEFISMSDFRHEMERREG